MHLLARLPSAPSGDGDGGGGGGGVHYDAVTTGWSRSDLAATWAARDDVPRSCRPARPDRLVWQGGGGVHGEACAKDL